jgi:hypothetical protein
MGLGSWRDLEAVARKLSCTKNNLWAQGSHARCSCEGSKRAAAWEWGGVANSSKGISRLYLEQSPQ